VTADDPRKPKFRKVFAKAASTWTSLGVAGAAAVAAAALGSWPILAIGGAAYAALVGWDLSNPEFWKKALGNRSEPVALPDPKKLIDRDLAKSVEAIVGARAEVARVLKETPADIQANLAGALAQLGELERHAAGLAARGETLCAYLQTIDGAAVRAEVADLERRAKGARDAEARTQYASALAARREQLGALDDIGDALDRVRAQLAAVAAAYAGLPPKMVRMRALDAQALDELSGSVSDELSHMNGEIRVFEETLKSLAEVKRE